MVLGFDARTSTKAVDAVVLPSSDVLLVRQMTARIADEFQWDPDWLNDEAKGFLLGRVELIPLYSNVGIRVFRPSTAQLLAMKLVAWRDDVDIADARLLLKNLSTSIIEETWVSLLAYVRPGLELKARYALEDLWQSA